MQYTPNYNLGIAEGTDQVNLLTQCYPNFSTIDTAMKANADAGVTLATETKTGTNHALVRSNTEASVIRFVATSNYTTGDTFTVDAQVVTAVLPSGEALQTGAFVINASVLAVLVGTQLTVYAVGAGSTDAETLQGHNAAYFATADDLQTVSDTADDAAEAAANAMTAATASRFVELWSNPSPGSIFTAQTVALDLASYAAVYIMFKVSKDSVNIRCANTYAKIDTLCNMPFLEGANSSGIISRDVTVNASGVIFGNGTHNGSANNEKAIPYKIYGIK